MGLYDLRKISPGLHEASPKAILAVNLSCTPSEGVEKAHPRYGHQRTIFAVNLPSTPSEGVVFPRHFPTPSEGVVDAQLRCGHRRATLTNLLRGALSFSTA